MRVLSFVAGLLMIATLLTPQVTAASNAACDDNGSGTGVIALRCSDYLFQCNGSPSPSHPNCYFRLEIDVSAPATAIVIAEATTAYGSVSCTGLGGCSAGDSIILLEHTGGVLSCSATVIGTGTASMDCAMFRYAWTWDRP